MTAEAKTDVVKSGREEKYLLKDLLYKAAFQGSSSNMIVSIREPLTYEADGKLVVDDITSGKSVV